LLRELQDSYDELLDDFNNKKAHEGMDCYVSNEELDELRAENEHLRSERDEAEVELPRNPFRSTAGDPQAWVLNDSYEVPENY
jgi:hypothetical protein